jgi:hypothetical protein
MPRGRVRAIYVTDASTAFWVWVDRDAFADPNRGWTAAPPGTSSPLGRGFLPRRVVGVDSTGKTHYARCATTNSALWVTEGATWTIEGTDGQLYTAHRVGRQQEHPVP